MKSKFGIIFFVFSILFLAGAVFFTQLQVGTLNNDNTKNEKKIQEVQDRIDKVKASEKEIQKEDSVNSRDIGNSIARLQMSMVPYYSKIISGKIKSSEKKTFLGIAKKYCKAVNLTEKTDVNDYISTDYSWYFNPNYRITYDTIMNYSPGLHSMLWIVHNKDTIAGIAIANFNSQSNAVSDLTVIPSKNGRLDNFRFKGAPTQKEIEKFKETHMNDDDSDNSGEGLKSVSDDENEEPNSYADSNSDNMDSVPGETQERKD